MSHPLEFGGLLTRNQAQAIIVKGQELAVNAKTAREYNSAMRPLLQLLKATQGGASHVLHNHLHIETMEQKREKLDAISAELGLSFAGEDNFKARSQPSSGAGGKS